MKQRIVFIHGNQSSGGWAFAWTPWLKQELEKADYNTVFETMPDSIIGRQEYWLPFMHDVQKIGKDDVVVGWSTGAVAIMRYAEKYPIKASALISPSYTDLGDELEKQSGYFVDPWDWGKIKGNQDKIALFYGDNDPYIPQEEFKFVGNKLGSENHCIARGEHFIERNEFPELLTWITASFLANTGK